VATNPSAAFPPPHKAGSGARRLRRLVVFAAVLLCPVLAGCGAGFHAETNEIYQPGPGITVRNTSVYALNALVVTDGRGDGTLVAGLLNKRPQPDALQSVSVTSSSGRRLQTTITGGTVALPPQKLVQLADTGAVRVSGTLLPGTICSLALTFQNSAPIQVRIPVVTSAPPYDTVPVGPVSASATPRQSNS
jgi:hypothetical protein